MHRSKADGLLSITQVRRSRLVDECTDQLRRLIVSLELQPGTVLRQEEVARMLGVSRTPLREALRVLERDGLLRSLPSGTVEVVKLTRDEAVQLSLFREVIDGLAARLTVETGGGQALAARLRMRMTEMESSLASIDMRRWLGAHVAFHSEVVASSGNVWVQQLLSLVRMGSQSVYLVQGPPPDPSDPRFAAYQRYLAEHIEYHRDLLIEIERNDPDAAEKAARWHIRRTRHWLLASPSGQPQT